MSFVKIYRSIFDSSVWAESIETRMVWIVILIKADPRGRFAMSPVEIARLAGVPVEAVEHALERLSSPDPYSKNEEHDGRRIVPLTDSACPVWQIVSFKKYRFMKAKTESEENEHHALYQRSYRDAKAMEREVEKRLAEMSQESRDVSPRYGFDTEGEGEGEGEKDDPSDRSSSDVDWKDLERRWNEYAQTNGLAQIRTITKSRKGHVRERVREYGPDAIDRLFEELARIGPNMLGENDIGGWSITFDYCFRPSKFGPIVEGAHRRRDRSKRSGSGDEFADALAAQWDDG